MSDIVTILNMLGLTGYIVGIIIAMGAIALYFAFIRKA